MRHRSSGGNPPTADAVAVRRAGNRAPYRAVARVELDAYGSEVRVLTCGHEKTGKDRPGGRYPCYDCQVVEARRILGVDN